MDSFLFSAHSLHLSSIQCIEHNCALFCAQCAKRHNVQIFFAQCAKRHNVLNIIVLCTNSSLFSAQSLHFLSSLPYIEHNCYYGIVQVYQLFCAKCAKRHNFAHCELQHNHHKSINTMCKGAQFCTL